MHESEAAESTPESDETEGVDATDDVAQGDDETLTGFERDLANVESALDSLDADDLDAAEALVAGLGDVETPAPVDDA
jgi:hypothetical protein